MFLPRMHSHLSSKSTLNTSHTKEEKVRVHMKCLMSNSQLLLHFVKAPCSSNFFLKCLNVLLSVVCYSFRSSRTSILIVSHNICISFFSNPYHLLIASHVKIKSDNAYKIPELKFIVTTYIFFFKIMFPKKKKIFNVLLFAICYLFKSSGILIQLSPLTLYYFIFKLSSPR